jgi:inhibitor of KinA sporulation pathway (predicted exonuclease)
MQYIVMDLESACRSGQDNPENREIVEIAAVRLGDSLAPEGEYDRSVDSFEAVLADFIQWIGEGSYSVATWGGFDIKQVQLDCRRHSLKFPKRFSKKHIDVRELFADRKHTRPCGLTQALQMMSLAPAASGRKAIDGARDIAAVFRRLG